jgi:hypothetical protein
MPHPPADETVPSLVIFQVLLALPSTPSTPVPVEVIAPMLVIVRGLSEGLRVKGPLIALLIFVPLAI